MNKNVFFLFGLFFGVVFSIIFFILTQGKLVVTDQNSCSNIEDSKYTEDREEGYTFIKPLLECDVDHEFQEISPLKDEIQEYIDKNKLTDRTSIYFRDLNTGTWIGIRENQKISPASMTKVVVALVTYRYAELYPNFLSEKISYTGKFKHERNLEFIEDTLQENTEYSISELVYRMLQKSDNESALFLMDQLEKKDPDFLDNFEAELGVDMTGMISLKEYSNVFRYLYNSSYLSRKNSEKILQLLSETDFIGGIRQPIPEDIIVSHKFGYFSPNNNIDTKMFNQCGIIYQEKNPYLLCVSIRSKANSNEEFQNNVMHSEELSQIIYDYLQ